jgi:hypothetical protein
MFCLQSNLVGLEILLLLLPIPQFFPKIPRFGTMIIPDRYKTVSTICDNTIDDTGIILPIILDVLAIPNGTN